MKNLVHFILLFLVCLAVGLEAREPYHTTVTVGVSSKTVSAPNLVDLQRGLRTSNIQKLIEFYTPFSAASLKYNIRGIFALAFFPANSTTLFVEIPQAGTTQAFTGATRDDSLTLFKDFIRDGGSKHRLLRAYAKYSPIDPIAGNPNSLMAQMAQADYLLGKLSPLSGCDCSWSAQPIIHQYQTGLNPARAFSEGFDTTTITLPLRYSYSPNLNWAFILDAPFTYNRNGGASSVFGSLGLGLRLPLTHNWSLTSIFRLGVGGTLDLCTSGDFVSIGLTSAYNYKIKEFVLTMTNYAGYISSANLWLTGVNFNYHLHNYILKNGLSITSCQGFTFFKRPMNFSLSFEDSYFGKDRLYIRHFDEVAVTLITTGINPYFNYDCLSLGFAYQFGQKRYKGYCFNLVYQF